MTTKKLSISLIPELISEIELRNLERSAAIANCLERYFSLIDKTRRGLRDRFSSNELGLIVDARNGTLWDSRSAQMLHVEIDDALADGLGEKWQVDGRALVEKLEALDLVQKLALVDAIERWWMRVSRDENPQPDEVLKRKLLVSASPGHGW